MIVIATLWIAVMAVLALSLMLQKAQAQTRSALQCATRAHELIKEIEAQRDGALNGWRLSNELLKQCGSSGMEPIAFPEPGTSGSVH